MPHLDYETRAAHRGLAQVCGVDEAGRGPLAGPVVAAAIILDRARIPDGLDDSKRLSAADRERLHDVLLETAIVSVAAAPPALIERINILGATLWAMRQAVLGLALRPDHVLIDGNRLPAAMPMSCETIVGGDGLSLSIAAASIVAKVTRDRMCAIMHGDEPQFGFGGHKGYGVARHLDALRTHGPGRHHRLGFAPCAEARLQHRG